MNTTLIGTYGQGGIEYASQLIDAGCNSLWFHGFDEAGFTGCESAGLNPCVEFKMFRASFEERPDLIPIGVDGKPIRYGRLVQGVCLSKSDFIEEREADLRDGVKAYSPTGIWFDYLTGAGWFEMPDPDLQESCFCPDCIAEFCGATGIDADSPEKIIALYQDEWTKHKCERVAGYGRQFSEIIKQSLPDAVIGAYMCPWNKDEFDGALMRIFAQDYDLFAKFIDVYTPLMYVEKSGRSPSWTREFMEQSADFVPKGHKVQPILDALDFPNALEELTKSAVPAWGFQMFAGAEIIKNRDSAKRFADLIALLS